MTNPNFNVEKELNKIIEDFKFSLRPKRKVHRLLRNECNHMLEDVLIDEAIIVDVYKFFTDTPAKEKAVSKTNNRPKLEELIKRVIFVEPKTVVLWNDGTKTIVKADGEKFDKEKGLLMAYFRKYYGENYMKDLTSTIENAEECKANKKKRGKVNEKEK